LLETSHLWGLKEQGPRSQCVSHLDKALQLTLQLFALCFHYRKGTVYLTYDRQIDAAVDDVAEDFLIEFSLSDRLSKIR
jgi:hypothetical protein